MGVETKNEKENKNENIVNENTTTIVSGNVGSDNNNDNGKNTNNDDNDNDEDEEDYIENYNKSASAYNTESSMLTIETIKSPKNKDDFRFLRYPTMRIKTIKRALSLCGHTIVGEQI